VINTTKPIYLDHSATTPVDQRVADKLSEFMTSKYGNPSSIHSFGRDARNAMLSSRSIIAQSLNCNPEEIYFTSGGTESDNMALLGYVRRNGNPGNRVIISNIEHPAVKKSAEELERLGFEVVQVLSDSFGQVNPDDVLAEVNSQTILVSIMHVNNEVGTINDISAIGRELRTKDIAFHTDAVQSFGKLPIDAQKMNIDMLSLSSHKIYGPKGVGAIFIRSGIKLQPLLFGGRQEEGVRMGTENMSGIVGLAEAVSICQNEMISEAKYLTELRDQLHTSILNSVENVTLNGHPTDRLPGNLNLTFHGVEAESLLMALDLEGIAVSSGSACSSGSTQPSGILLSLGISEEDAQSSLRFTLGRSNTPEEISLTADVVITTVKRLRKMSDREYSPTRRSA